ncbi:ScbA/BarX family gamma-butyrolactone biosynthesis protein [Streptomyces sp. NPDC046831]|uniref:ScbA/BarX family gamma-butyrolactone biosynthesis protein n=1 Tax=Streptomyces sp. NPDC046831 TaxID=3154805 RepID=UPI0033DAA765
MSQPSPTEGSAQGKGPAGHRADRPEAALTSTVARELVHRAAVAEVFLTGWSPVDDKCTRVTAQWPRAHSFYRPLAGHHDPLLVAETIRQAGVLACHAVYDVPLRHRFLMWGLHTEVYPRHLVVGSRPTDLDLDVTFTELTRAGSRLNGRYRVTIRNGDEVVATGGAHFTCTAPAVYRRLRGERHGVRPRPEDVTGAALEPVTPAAVGRREPSDVVLAPTDVPHRWQLRPDIGHPILFDHVDDHIPGMVLLEAARQAATALAPAGGAVLPISLDGTFQRYVEFDSPCWIEAALCTEGADDSARAVRVTGTQDGETVFTCELVVGPAPVTGSR